MGKFFEQKLKVETIKNGYILPKKKGKGGVIDSNKDFVNLSYHNGEFFKFGGTYNIPKHVEFVDDTIIYLGVFIKQWGHFILDSLSRAWFINTFSSYQREKIKVAFIKKDKPISGNYLEALKLLGIEENNIVEVDKPVKYRKIIIPQMAMNAKHEYNNEYPKIFKTMISNAKIKDIVVPKKVYLSRTHLRKARKNEFGEINIENNFRLNEYSTIHPEEKSLVEQIAIFQKSKEIVCLNGSIPFNVVFSNPSLKLIIINKTSIPHLNIKVLLKMEKITPVYLNGYIEPFKNFPKTLGDGPFILTFSPDLVKYFNARNYKYTNDNGLTKVIYIKYTIACFKFLIKDCLRKMRTELYTIGS